MTSNIPEHVDVVIIGAGIAGLGLACALARYHARVLLIERRHHTGGIHRGDSLLPKATASLARWGALDAILAANAEPVGHLELYGAGGERLFETPLTSEDDASPYLVLPHAEIERVLMCEALKSGRVTLARPASARGLIRDNTGRVRGVTFRSRGALHEVRASVVVAADGQTSRIREALGVARRVEGYDHAYLGLEADRPEGYKNAMRLHLHPRGGVLIMPRPERVGVGVLVEAGSARAWLNMEDEALASELAERAPILKGMRLHREGAHVYELTRSHASRYTVPGAVVIGDAAHTTNPTAGQGMAMALTDAGALADRLGPALDLGDGAIDRALGAYEAAMWPENAAVIRASHRLAVFYGLRGELWTTLKVGLLRVLGRRAGGAIAAPIIKRFLKRKSAQPTPLDHAQPTRVAS